jgi:hypothetical protein
MPKENAVLAPADLAPYLAQAGIDAWWSTNA